MPNIYWHYTVVTFLFLFRSFDCLCLAIRINLAKKDVKGLLILL